jgi:hypothetical protein
MKQINNQREFLQALLDGETVLYDGGGGYWELKENRIYASPGLVSIPTYFPVHIKPKTININGFEVPEPLRKAPEEGDICYCAFVGAGPYKFNYNPEDDAHAEWLEMGVLHSDIESAKIHHNALLSFTRQDTK